MGVVVVFDVVETWDYSSKRKRLVGRKEGSRD